MSEPGQPTSDSRADGSLLFERLRAPGPMVSVELRPPRSGLDAEAGMNAWIDLHHTVGRFARDERFVFLTDNAVGSAEEENLAHVGANLGEDVELKRIVPILTCKHSLEYCTMFASRAASEGFEALTVLGGDRGMGPPRCVPHGRDLREIVRGRLPRLALGGWVNPHRPAAEQVGFVVAPDAHADFALTQIVSHHALSGVTDYMERLAGEGRDVPTVFGVFFYRSAKPGTLRMLSRFFPVPADGITRDFEAGATPEEVCARSIRELRRVGAEKIYVSNLGNRGAAARLRRILEWV
jgi:5,10-methylenetetrahydrofolate reductase